MRSEPTWLDADDITSLNEAAVTATGEPFTVLDRGLLESAAAKPINHWHYGEDDVVALAVEFLLGIARNHPFEQGNKRTALLAALLFLECNGYAVEMPDDALVAEIIIKVITGEVPPLALHRLFSVFINEIRENVVPIA